MSEQKCNSCKTTLSLIKLIKLYRELDIGNNYNGRYCTDEYDDCPYSEPKCTFKVYNKCYSKDKICEKHNKKADE